MRADTPRDRPKTTLNAFDIACVVIGGIIGIGIFFTPKEVAKVVDSTEQVMAAWAIGGAMILFGAFVYARLSQLAPGDGGQFEYLRRAFGRLPAFLYGWCNLLVVQSGAIAVVGLVMASYLGRLLDVEFSDSQKVAISAITITALTLINSVGLIVGKLVQISLTVIKTSAVFAIVAIAILAEGNQPNVVAPVRPEVGFWAAMGAAILPVLFACGGWQHGSFVATVARRPLRDVPIGIVAGVVVVVVGYLTINLAYLDLLGLEGAANSDTITVDAVGVAVGGDASQVVERCFAGLIVMSALGVMNTICMAPPYVLHAMAGKGVFFSPVGRLHARFGTPLLAIMIQGAWAVTLLCTTAWLAWQVNETAAPGERVDPLSFLLEGVVFVDWMFYGACGVALLVLLRRRVEWDRGDRAYFGAGALFALSALAVTIGAIVTRPLPTIAGLAVLGIGVIAYLGFRGAESKRS